MDIHKTKFKDLIILKNNRFKDNRGYFREVFQKRILKKNLVFTVFSSSKKNVLRGLHLQKKNPQGKYISVIKGKILDVVVDCRKNSKTFGKYYKTIISDKNCISIFIPPGFAHGFLCLDKENIVVYSCTKYRNKKSEISIKWNDRDLNIKWPIKKPILSTRDKKSKSFRKLKFN